jgi:hypothetical protein
MVLSALGKDAPAQCRIVELVDEVGGCCTAADADTTEDPSAVPEGCNDPFNPAAIPALYSSENFNVTATPAETSEESIAAGLAGGNPVQIRYQWDERPDGHFALIVGSTRSASAQFYLIADPEYGRIAATFSHIANAYGKGRLAQAWTF